jgi:hypothetical protein
MEAALWGRLETVRVLLSAEANTHLRDLEGRSAIDLAQPIRKNEKERHSRCSEAAADCTWERDSDRRHIVILLGDSNGDMQHGYTGPLSESERNEYRFGKSVSETAITLYGPIDKYSVSSIIKTAAFLDRGRQFDRISATSGWRPGSLPPNDKTRQSWTEQVYYIASIVGHKLLDKEEYDHGKPGQYLACHAEKKLIAYLIDRHVFMPRDRKPDRGLKNSILEVGECLGEGGSSSAAWARVCNLDETKGELNRSLGGSCDKQEIQRLRNQIRVIDQKLLVLESDANVAVMRAKQKEKAILLKRDKRHGKLMQLSRNEPRFSLKRAVILSSNEICKDCEMFKKRVNRSFGLDIDIQMSA